MRLTLHINGQLKALLQRYRDIFSSGYLDLGHARSTQHVTDTGDAPPIKQPLRRVPYHRITARQCGSSEITGREDRSPVKLRLE